MLFWNDQCRRSDVGYFVNPSICWINNVFDGGISGGGVKSQEKSKGWLVLHSIIASISGGFEVCSILND